MPVALRHLHAKANTTVSAARTVSQQPSWGEHTGWIQDIADALCLRNPEAINCTEALVASGPRCADPAYNLCDNGGYFCCLPGKLCYSNGNTDGCADADYKLSAGEYFLDTIRQVQPSTTSGGPQPSGSPAASESTAPSNETLSTSPSPLSPSSSSSSGGPSGGLNRSDEIDIAVPMAIGIPSLINSFWLAWRKWRRDKHNQASST